MIKNQSEPYISKYMHSKGRQLGIPVSGAFELTARCNFNCPMCYVHMTAEQVAAAGRELTTEQWLSIAREARDMGMLFALLTGGEPVVRKDFFDIYRGMKELGLLISINSNGSMLKGKILEQFLEDPPARFNISLYGGSNETYRNMCGQPVYDDVKHNIRALRQAGVDVSLNLSITPYNKQDIALIYQDAQELDVNVRASAYMYPPIRINDDHFGCAKRLSASEAAELEIAWDQLRMTPEQFDARANNILNKIRTDDGNCPIEADEGVRCRAGSTSFWMTWDGKMMPCGMMQVPVVHPLETGFRAAWEQLRLETGKIRTPSACGSCAHKDVCVVCAAMCYTETGRFDGVPEYVCAKTQEQVRLFEKLHAERKQV